MPTTSLFFAIEMALAAFALIILTGTNAYYTLLGVPAGITAEELLVYGGQIRNVFLFTYVIVVALCLLHWKKILLGIAAVWPVALLVAIAWASTLWTVAPELTSQRCIALTVTTLMGIYLFVRFDLDTLLRFLTAVVAILVLGCFVWIALVPDYGVHGEGALAGAWRGIFFHKNPAGIAMVYCLAIILAAWASGVMPKAVLFVLGLLVVAMMAGSTSKTALLASLALLGGMVAANMVRGQAIKAALATVLVLAIVWHGALLVAASYGLVLEALGKDPTLTGRTDIWVYTWQSLMQKPLTGYGYEAYWNGEMSPGSQYALYWNTPHSHNGWLEVGIAIGIPATAVMFIVMVVTLVRGIFLARYYPVMTPAVLIIPVCFSMFTISISEAVFLGRHTLDWILMVAVIGTARALTSDLRHSKDVNASAHHTLDYHALKSRQQT